MAIKIHKQGTGSEADSGTTPAGGGGDVSEAAGGALTTAGGALAVTTAGAAGASPGLGGGAAAIGEDDDEGAEFVREPEVLDVGGPGRRLRPMPPVGGDEQSKFVPAKQTAWDWMQSNHRPILLGMLAIILVSAAIVTVRWWQDRSASEASAALIAGLKPLDQWTVQEAEALQPHGQPDKRTPTKGKLPDAQARAQAMLKEVEANLSAYEQADIGGELRLLGAAAALRAGDKAKAGEYVSAAMKQLPPQTTQPFAAQVQASLLANDGKLEDALALYQQILAQGPHYAPFALMNIGALREQMGKGAEAAEAYRQLLQTYPQFQFRAQVRHRLGLLVEDLDGYLAQKQP